MKTKNSIYLIGGAGYIGSIVAKHLYIKFKNYNVIIIDKKIYNNQKYHFKKIRYISCDINDIHKKIRFVEKDIIIFLAGLVGDPITNKYKKLGKKINNTFIKKFFLKIKKTKIDRILFVSTCSNYGLKKNSLLDENSLLNPISNYAKDKVKIENYIMDLKSINPICIFRFATAFGFSERMRLDLTVNDFLYQALSKNKIEIYDPNTWRPYCHVKDFARAIQKFISSDSKLINKQIYNIGSNKNNYRKIDIINNIKKNLPLHIRKNLKVTILKKSVDKRNYKVNFAKMRKKLKFNTKYNLEYGIKEMLKKFNQIFLKSNKDKGNYLIKKSYIKSL